MVAITNPTGESIDLSNYYLTDATDSPDFYYNLPSGVNYWSGNVFDFICRFPNLSIEPNSTITIGLNTSTEFQEYYNFSPDFALGDGDLLNAISGENTIGIGSENENAGVLADSRETLILFYWDGESPMVQDVDYFLWNDSNYDDSTPEEHPMAINKEGVEEYLPDTPIEQQSFIRHHGEDSSFVRVSYEETGESETGGNGITGHDETSEDFLQSWNIILNPEIVYGCTDPDAVNYNPNATIDDDSCLLSVKLSVAPYPFVPELGEKIQYSYTAPNLDYRILIRIFDLSGRFVTTLGDFQPSELKTTEYWNGRTHLGELVMPGTYMMHIDATEFTSGNSQSALAPVVVGSRLK